MTERIFETSLRGFQVRTPFKPFVIELVSGSEVIALDRETVVTRSGTAVYFAPDGTIALFDAESVS